MTGRPGCFIKLQKKPGTGAACDANRRIANSRESVSLVRQENLLARSCSCSCSCWGKKQTNDDGSWTNERSDVSRIKVRRMKR